MLGCSQYRLGSGVGELKEIWCIEMDKEIKITQVRSTIGRLPAHRRTVRALGLRRIGHTVVKKDSPAIRGMINTVNYLLQVEE